MLSAAHNAGSSHASRQHPAGSAARSHCSAPVERRTLFKGAAAASTISAAPALAKGSVGGPSVKLCDGTQFPVVSFGLQVYDDEAAYKYTTLALECGYRNFFASVLAGNQKGFGKAVRNSGIPRDELYICGSVLSNRARGEEAAFQSTRRGCDANFRDLNIGKLDMIMLGLSGPDAESIQGQWRGLENMRKDGGVTSLAVSNFSPQQLDVVLKSPGKPTVNQLPLGVGYKTKQNADLLKENKKRGVLVQAWSPLRVLSSGALERVRGRRQAVRQDAPANRPEVDSGQGRDVHLPDDVQKHFQEDIDVFDFELSAKDLAFLDGENLVL